MVRPESHYGYRRNRVLGEANYSLSDGEARRIRVPLARRDLEYIRQRQREDGNYGYVAQAEAGPAGAVEARSGRIVLAFAGASARR